LKWTLTVLILVFLATVGVQALGGSLPDYEKRVFRAAEQIERIKKDPDYADEGIGYVKNLVPDAETIEIDGQKVTTDNRWLHSLLDRSKTERDPQTRLALLTEAAARLRTLDEQIRDGSKGSSGASASSQARDDIRGILARPEYRKKVENPVAAYMTKLRRQVLEFLRDLWVKIFSAISGAGSAAGWVFRGIVILALAGAVFAIVKMIVNRKGRKKRRPKRTVLGEEIEAGTTAVDLALAAREAASSGDFRTAMRKLYIALLFELAERGVIELESSATNHEYLARLSKYPKLTSPMTYLTERFDYIWYGMFPSSAEDFSACLGAYDQAMKNAEATGRKPAAN